MNSLRAITIRGIYKVKIDGEDSFAHWDGKSWKTLDGLPVKEVIPAPVTYAAQVGGDMKPHIFRAGFIWMCRGNSICGSGMSPSKAYADWQWRPGKQS